MSEDRSVVLVNGVELNVEDVGSGAPALVFLHYWGGSGRTWRPVIEALSAANRCVAIDFRGWGRSDKRAQDHSLGTLCEDVLRLIDLLDLTDFVLVGHSMGGKVAQLVASQQPAGLKRLILLAPAPPTGLPVPAEQRRDMIASYQAREGVESVIGILCARPMSAAHREQVIEDTLCGSIAAKREWPENGMLQDISAESVEITVPVRIVVGGADEVESETALRAAFKKVLPSADFVVLPGVGHLSPLEASAEVVAAIRSALAT